jgi:hypothetical protein
MFGHNMATYAELAEYVVQESVSVIGENSITEFTHFFPESFEMYGLEKYNSVQMSPDNYLHSPFTYKHGRCTIGIVPYGPGCTTAVAFYTMSMFTGDYIGYVLPISQYLNNIKFYDFDFIYSKDIGRIPMHDYKKHCCFNLYSRPKNNILHTKPVYKNPEISVHTVRKEHTLKDFTLILCRYGKHLGRISAYPGQYSQELGIKIRNTAHKDTLTYMLSHTQWPTIYPMGKERILHKWHIYKYIKEFYVPLP